MYTIFPHCPRCKANAPVGRWQESYPTEPHECSVCGQIFVPNDHHSSERDEYDWDATSLEKQLGEAGLDQFTKRFLLYRGCTEQQAEEVLDNHKNGPVIRQIAQARKRQSETLHRVRGLVKTFRVTDALPRNLSFSLTDDIELELVLVPSGEFLMGSPETEGGHGDDESPQHVVRFACPFYIGRFPVTQAQWKAVTGKNPSGHKGNPDLPVDRVSWFNCQEFCDLLCSRLKRAFRLPSEAEWEYACRAGTTTAFAFGEVLPPDSANFTPRDLFTADPSSDPKRSTTPVGSFAPNAWGIYDMHGNVQEWCEDAWHPNYLGAPTDGSAWLEGEEKQAFRVVRGGWCSATEFVCRSASRSQYRADGGGKDDEDDEDDEQGEPLAGLMGWMFTPHGLRVVCEIE